MRISVALVLGLVLAGLALPTQNVAAQFLEKKVLTLAAAQRMVAAAQAEAERNHWAGVIAVVDDGGWPILMVRMDNAGLFCERGGCRAARGARRRGQRGSE